MRQKQQHKPKLYLYGARFDKSLGNEPCIYAKVLKSELEFFSMEDNIITLPIVKYGDHIFESDLSVYIVVDKSL